MVSCLRVLCTDSRAPAVVTLLEWGWKGWCLDVVSRLFVFKQEQIDVTAKRSRGAARVGTGGSGQPICGVKTMLERGNVSQWKRWLLP